MPIIILTGITFGSINVSEVPLSTLVGGLASVSFVIFSFFIPRYIDELRETHRMVVEDSITGQVSQFYINTHKKTSRILLRSVVMTLILAIQPILIHVKIPAGVAGRADIVLITHIYRSVIVATAVLLISNIGYLVYFISRDYYDRSRDIEGSLVASQASLKEEGTNDGDAIDDEESG